MSSPIIRWKRNFWTEFSNVLLEWEDFALSFPFSLLDPPRILLPPWFEIVGILRRSSSTCCWRAWFDWCNSSTSAHKLIHQYFFLVHEPFSMSWDNISNRKQDFECSSRATCSDTTLMQANLLQRWSGTRPLTYRIWIRTLGGSFKSSRCHSTLLIADTTQCCLEIELDFKTFKILELDLGNVFFLLKYK